MFIATLSPLMESGLSEMLGISLNPEEEENAAGFYKHSVPTARSVPRSSNNDF
jgi:hypothetical protein